MADIKQCDKCGMLFNPRGAWQSLTATTFRIEDGLQARYDTQMELCAGCTIVPTVDAETEGGDRRALASGRQLIDETKGIWRDTDWTFHVKRGEQWIGPFTSKGSAVAWIEDTPRPPVDQDAET